MILAATPVWPTILALTVLGPLVALLLAWWTRRWTGRLEKFKLVVMALFGLTYAVSIYAAFIEPQQINVRQVEVKSELWTLAPIKVAVLTDVHFGDALSGVERAREIVAATNAEEPDLILLTGDFVGFSTVPENVPDAAEEVSMQALDTFRDLKAPSGVVGVLGNHDWWWDGTRTEARLTDAGVTMLANQAVYRAHPGKDGASAGEFWLIGLEDLWSTRAEPDPAAASASVPPGSSAIALFHEPDLFKDIPPGIALSVAGHSHCGQINFPGFDNAVRVRGALEYVCGRYTKAAQTLLVSAGLGQTGLPLRLRAPPEILIVTLSSAEVEGPK
jgi:uncharacterized protein